MEYNIQLSMRLDAQSLQTLIRTLDGGPHGLMRGIVDTIINQARQQEEEAKKAAQPAPAPEAPAPEAPAEAVGGTD